MFKYAVSNIPVVRMMCIAYSCHVHFLQVQTSSKHNVSLYQPNPFVEFDFQILVSQSFRGLDQLSQELFKPTKRSNDVPLESVSDLTDFKERAPVAPGQDSFRQERFDAVMKITENQRYGLLFFLINTC